MKRAYSYIRFSRTHQIEGDSLRRQSKATSEYCERHKLILDESLNLKDLGVSAFRGRNAQKGALGRFITACEEGIVPPGSALIVEGLDRISRQSPRRTINLLTQLLDLGIEVHLTMVGKIFKPDKDDGIDLIYAVALAMRAHEESETKSRRLKEAFAEKRKKAAEGKDHVSKTLPWWLSWDKTGKKIVCEDDRRKILKRIFKEVAGGKSPLEVARNLNDEGVKTYRPRAKAWLDSRVRDTIRSDAPLGIIGPTPKSVQQGAKWDIPGYYPKIIHPDLAAKARATIKQNAKKLSGRKPSGVTVPNLLKSIARYKSHWCRFSVRRSNAGTWNGYYEALDDNRRVLWVISAKQLEPILLVSIADLSPENLKPPSTGNAETAMLRGEVRELESTLENIRMAVEAGSKIMVQRLVEVENELTKARELLTTAEATDSVAVDTHALSQMSGYAIEDLKNPDRRPEIAALIRRLVARVQLGSSLDDLPADSEHNILTLENGDTILEDTRPDPTGTRGKRSLAIHVKFHGGGEMAIQRGTSSIAGYVEPDQILITRIFRKGDEIVN